MSRENGPRVVIIGGGLAGLAAAAAVAESGAVVTLLEARRQVGGRAASFEDPLTGGLVDACQHVAMGCCTNFLDLCRKAGFAEELRRDRTLWFIDPENNRAECAPSRVLPAPLHLAPLLLGMRHFSLAEKVSLGRGMIGLARWRPEREALPPTALQWLERACQSERVIRLFWQPVIESALGEAIDLVSAEAARKVCVDGFLAHRDASDLFVPTVPLSTLFGERLTLWLSSRGVVIRTGCGVGAFDHGDDRRVVSVRVDGDAIPCDAVILAVPWRAAARLVPEVVPSVDDRVAGSPITAIHLWFDRDCIDLPHAVLVGRVAQWVFKPSDAPTGYCQVVISASRGLFGGDRDRLRDAVVDELRSAFPSAREANLLASKVVTDPTAVLSVRPGVEALRPSATTKVPNLFLAGDWTATGWPSTMEGAVRSGRLAAASLARSFGLTGAGLSPDLPKGLLVRLLMAGRR